MHKCVPKIILKYSISSERIKDSQCIVHLNRDDSGKYYWVAHIHLGHNHFQYIPGDKCREVRNLFRNKSESVNTRSPWFKSSNKTQGLWSTQETVKSLVAGKTRYKEKILESLFFYFYLKNKKGIACLRHFTYELTLAHVPWSWVVHTCEVHPGKGESILTEGLTAEKRISMMIASVANTMRILTNLILSSRHLIITTYSCRQS